VFRDGPVKRGRLREFLQCDVDVVGIAGPEAETELMQLAVDCYRKLEIPVVLRWNNRRFLGDILEAIGVTPEQTLSVMLTLDKLLKIGARGVEQELTSKGLDRKITRGISELVALSNPTFEQIREKYGIAEKAGAQEVLALQAILRQTGLENTCRFDPFLSRGLSFYTGTVYEVFDANGTFPSSLGGGGRYDSIIGQLTGRDDVTYPTVGLSFGMESIMEMLADRDIPAATAPVVIIPIGSTVPEALNTAAAFRASGIRTSIDTSGRKLKKLLASLAAKGIRFVVLIGENEAALGQVRLKDMAASTEYDETIEEAISLINR
jgi:histidyl-tRNA synthetase